MSFAPSTILSPRQRHFYVHRANILKVIQTFGIDGVAVGPTYEVVALAVPCHFEIRPTVDDSAVFSRYPADNLLTLDILHMGEFQECGPDYLVHNQTLVPGGAQSANWGEWYVVRGPARAISRSHSRQAGKKSFFIYRLAQPPEGAPEIEALAL